MKTKQQDPAVTKLLTLQNQKMLKVALEALSDIFDHCIHYDETDTVAYKIAEEAFREMENADYE